MGARIKCIISSMGCGSSSGAATQKPAGNHVNGIILEGDDGFQMDGHVMQVGADGTLDMGNVDKLFGASKHVIDALPVKVIAAPGGHRFRQACVVRWLSENTTCPI